MKNEKWLMEVLGVYFMLATITKILNDKDCDLNLHFLNFIRKLRSAGLLYTPDENEEIKNDMANITKEWQEALKKIDELQADLTAERERAKELATKLEECQAELEKCRENKNKAARLLANASKRYHELDDELEKVKGENERLREALEYIAYGDKSNFVTWGDVRGAAKRGLKTEASDEGGT